MPLPGVLNQEFALVPSLPFPEAASVRRTQPWQVLAVVLLLSCQVGFCWFARARSLAAHVDLRVFYAAGHMVLQRRGPELYDLRVQQQVQDALFGGGQTLPFLYPACMTLLFAPLALLPYHAAFALFLLCNAGVLVLSALLLRASLAPLRVFPAPLFAAAALCLFPVSIALMQGQVSCLLLLVFTAAYLLLRRNTSFAAGLVLALALVKFQLALPIAALFLLWKQWRVCAGFLCGAALLCGLSLLVAGPAGMHGWLVEIAGIGSTTVHDPARAHAAYGMSAANMPNLHGLCAKLLGGSAAGQVLCGLGSLALLLWSARQRPSLPLALCCAMLVSYHMQPYDLLLLLLPLSVAAASLLRRTRAEPPARADVVLFCVTLLLLLLPLAPLLLVAKLEVVFSFAVAGCLWLHTRKLASLGARQPSVEKLLPNSVILSGAQSAKLKDPACACSAAS